jgi:site-specific DNA-methyltransferase (adenine-specific)
MQPYAQGKRWTLYAGDCLALRPLIPADASIISDVPYGMDWDTDSTRFSGGSAKHNRHRGQGRDDWGAIEEDAQPFDPAPWLGFPRVVLFGANHYAARLPVGTTLVWLKKTDRLFGTFLSDAEIAWMKGGHGVYCFRKQFPPPTRAMEAGLSGGHPGHPTQKPIDLMAWCMDRAKVPADGLVCDPYCGSGSTGVAALRRGGTFIGFEKVSAHLATSARRLAEAEAGGVQLELIGGAA